MKKLFGLILVAGSLYAGPITFDFESLATGSYTTLTTTVGGVTMTVTRQGGNGFSLDDISASPHPASWGSRTLSPFNDTSNSAFILSFSTAINSFSVQLGDYDADSDTWSATAFSGATGTGSNIGNTTGNWGLGDFTVGDPPQTASLNVAGMRSIVLIGGSAAFPNSLYYDNVVINTASAVPEPSTLLMVPAGLAALLFIRRRKATN